MISVVISRTLLGLDPLEVENPSAGYQVLFFGEGSRVQRNTFAASPVSDGAVLTGSTADLQYAPLSVRCWDVAGGNKCLENIVALERALNQWSFTITSTLTNDAGSTVDVYSCFAANHSRGVSGVYEANSYKGGWQDFRAEIPRQPNGYSYIG